MGPTTGSDLLGFAAIGQEHREHFASSERSLQVMMAHRNQPTEDQSRAVKSRATPVILSQSHPFAVVPSVWSPEPASIVGVEAMHAVLRTWLAETGLELEAHRQTPTAAPAGG